MTWLHKWEMGDPFEVCARREAIKRNQHKGGAMTQGESNQVEELIEIWYRWSMRYKPRLGAPRISAYGRGAGSSDTYVDSEEIDNRIESDKAEQIDACLDSLPWEKRSAVDVHACNLAAGNKVIRNKRMSTEQHHIEYQAAKGMLLPMLRKRGMIRDSDPWMQTK